MSDEEPRVHMLYVPAPTNWLTANSGDLLPEHRARLVRTWRGAVVKACEIADLPKGIRGPVAITAVIQYAGRRPVRDSPNLAPTMKAVIDGLCPPRPVRRRDGTMGTTKGYGLLVDDSDKVIPRVPTWKLEPLPIGAGLERGRVVLRIVDNSPAALF